MRKQDPRLTRAGVSVFNKPKRTPNHPFWSEKAPKVDPGTMAGTETSLVLAGCMEGRDSKG